MKNKLFLTLFTLLFFQFPLHASTSRWGVPLDPIKFKKQNIDYFSGGTGSHFCSLFNLKIQKMNEIEIKLFTCISEPILFEKKPQTNNELTFYSELSIKYQIRQSQNGFELLKNNIVIATFNHSGLLKEISIKNTNYFILKQSEAGLIISTDSKFSVAKRYLIKNQSLPQLLPLGNLTDTME